MVQMRCSELEGIKCHLPDISTNVVGSSLTSCLAGKNWCHPVKFIWLKIIDPIIGCVTLRVNCKERTYCHCFNVDGTKRQKKT